MSHKRKGISTEGNEIEALRLLVEQLRNHILATGVEFFIQWDYILLQISRKMPKLQEE